MAAQAIPVRLVQQWAILDLAAVMAILDLLAQVLLQPSTTNKTLEPVHWACQLVPLFNALQLLITDIIGLTQLPTM
jgi:hypothetical protein